MKTGLLDHVPLGLILPLIMTACLIVVEAGYRLGKWRHLRVADEKNEPVAAMVGAVLGLLAFMLAFTFSLAASRFDARRQAVIEEANAIGTAYLRTRLLPEPQGPEAAELFRRYVELRVNKMNSEQLGEVLEESGRLHEQIWSRGASAAAQDTHSIMTGLFLESLNECIDLHSKRVFVGLYSRIPTPLWMALIGLTAVGMLSLGYQAGLSGTHRSLEMPIFVLAFSCVLYLIVEIDRAHEGLIMVSQQPMVDLLRVMQSTPR